MFIFLSALAVLPVNTILPSLPRIAATFQADPALVGLSVTGYAIVTATIELIAGSLSDRCGRRPIVLVAVSAFIVASLGCALAANIGQFLVFRAMQASIDACFSIALVVIRETSGERKAASTFGYLAMGWAVAPMLGPLIGGSLDQMLGWRAIFLVFAVLGVAALALALHEMKETAAHSPRAKTAYLASYGKLVGSARFRAYTLCMAFSMATLYTFLGGAPLIAARSLNASGAELGLYMGMVPAGFILGSYLAGRYAARRALGTTLVTARLLTCAGLLVGLILAISGTTHALAFFGPCIFIGVGNGLTMPAANAGVLSLRADLAGTAVGLAGAIRIAAGALMASMTGLFLGNSATIHVLLCLMLVPASLALLTALWAARLELHAAVPAV
jgi:Bcr/CflA subfamily drug resistance transporter